MSADMKDIVRCVICGKDLRQVRVHVDTCGEQCFKILFAKQRASAEVPEIQIAPSLGDAVHVGFERADLNSVFHTIARASGGAAFEPLSHFPCQVCEAHKITKKDLIHRLDELLAPAACRLSAGVVSCARCGRQLALAPFGGHELCECPEGRNTWEGS